MVHVIKNILRLSIGAILLPLSITVTRAFYAQFAAISVIDNRNQIFFIWGVALYLITHIFFFKPNYLYTLGHEGVHVLSTWFSLGKAKNMKVSNEGGSVETSKPNFFVTISPYFIPIYTIVTSLAYFTLSKFYDVSSYLPLFIFAIGFTFTMHIIMTVESLKVVQPDLLKTGYVLSLALIYVLNVLLAAFIVSLIFSGFSFKDMMLQFCDETKLLYMAIFSQLFGV
ncbi:MAG: hypothetical protein WCG78_00885 [Candidatus Omnitrophota bacterium]